jgi:hypothetical protein
MPVYRLLECDEVWKKERAPAGGKVCSKPIAATEELDRSEKRDLCDEAGNKARYVARADAFGSLAVVRCPSSCRSMRVQIWYDDPSCSWSSEPFEPDLSGHALAGLIRYCCAATCRYHLEVKCHGGVWGAGPTTDPAAVPVPATGEVSCSQHVIANSTESAKASASDKAAAETAAEGLASDVAYQRAVEKLDSIRCPPTCMFIKAQIDLGKSTLSAPTTSAARQGTTTYEASATCTWSLWAECTDQVGRISHN